ncbi:MAG: adenylate/guanylate cyclase domain-containing protein [Hyphomonadaceae bacterium]|nr:adenylate/guanylate cyclase domain-containing protein [Hyphomonadaceae bacterium]
MSDDPSAPIQAEGEKRRLASVLVADICGYSTLAERDEDTALAVVRRVSALLNQTAQAHEGRLFHEAADGFFFEFASANQSMQAARSMLITVSQDSELAALAAVSIRIGMHLGDVQVEESGNLMGHGVNVAARLQQKADPGSILASSNLINALSQKRGRFWSKRKLSLKNIKRPVTAFNIRDQRSLVMALRDLASTMPIRLFGGTAAILVAMGMGVHVLMTEPDPDLGPIDRTAISASLQPLIAANRPVDDMVSALIRTNDFERAVADLRQEYATRSDQLSRAQSLDLLHQIAAIAVNRNAAIAEEIYQEILKLDPFDAEALLEMSKILRQRDFDSIAAANLAKALTDPDLSDRTRLRIEIERVSLDSVYAEPGRGAERFRSIAEEALALGLRDVAYKARYNAVRREYFALARTATDQMPASRFSDQIEETKAIAQAQIEADLLYDVSDTLTTLSTMQNHISDYEESIANLKHALEIETTLRRPSRMLAIHANLAYAHVAWSKQRDEADERSLFEAERHVGIVRNLAEREGLTSREYFNWYILAMVEQQRGNSALACSHFEKAIRAWPEKFLTDTDAEDMANELDCPI